MMKFLGKNFEKVKASEYPEEVKKFMREVEDSMHGHFIAHPKLHKSLDNGAVFAIALSKGKNGGCHFQIFHYEGE